MSDQGEEIKRPMNAFLFFKTTRFHKPDQAPEAEAQRPFGEVAQEAGAAWKALSDEEKAPYVQMAEEAKAQHAKDYPGYRYAPKSKEQKDIARKEKKVKKELERKAKRALEKAVKRQQLALKKSSAERAKTNAFVVASGLSTNQDNNDRWSNDVSSFKAAEMSYNSQASGSGSPTMYTHPVYTPPFETANATCMPPPPNQGYQPTYTGRETQMWAPRSTNTASIPFGNFDAQPMYQAQFDPTLAQPRLMYMPNQEVSRLPPAMPQAQNEVFTAFQDILDSFPPGVPPVFNYPQPTDDLFPY